MMRVVFMGTPEFSVPSLQALYDYGCEVVGVFTQPDRPKGRGNKMQMSPVKELALAHGTPVFQPEKIRKDGLEALTGLAPDLCVTAAFGQILSQKVLDVPKLGTINVHASLLPRHRGSAPINWAIMEGDAFTGVTTMFTERGIDTGDMLLSEKTRIGFDETAEQLTARLSTIGATVLIDTIKALEAGTLQRIPQKEEDATYDPMLTKEMGDIDWKLCGAEIDCRVRGLNPWPGTYCQTAGGVLKIRGVEFAAGSGEPGTVLAADSKNGLVVACGDGEAVRVTLLQAPGGKTMSSRDYFRGHTMKTDIKLWEEEL